MLRVLNAFCQLSRLSTAAHLLRAARASAAQTHIRSPITFAHRGRQIVVISNITHRASHEQIYAISKLVDVDDAAAE